MKLEISHSDFTEDELKLIERARIALAKRNSDIYFIVERTSYGWINQRIDALVYSNPLRLDFKAHTPEQVGQAFIGPMVPLTEDLFKDQHTFTNDFIMKITDCIVDYKKYIRIED